MISGTVPWTGTPASEEQIAACEAAHGVKFPDDYRSFLRIANGGLPDVASRRSHEHGSIGRLFEVNAANQEHDLWRAQLRYASRIPRTLMPIGHDASGNVVCIGLFGKTKGHVFCADLVKRHTTEIAQSFTRFLASWLADLDARPDAPVN